MDLSLNIRYLNQEEYRVFFILAILVISAYITQFNNTISLIKNKYKEILNIDIIKSEIEYTLKDPVNSKFFFFPAMWVLIFTSIFIGFYFNGTGTKWIFYILAIALLIQNFIHYNFILNSALEIETNPKKTIDKVLKEKEWIVIRESVSKEKINNLLKKLRPATEKELSSFGFKIDEKSKYLIDKENNIYELYGEKYKKLDKLNLVLSSIFNELYKPYDIIKKSYIAIIEPFFVIISLYLALIIN